MIEASPCKAIVVPAIEKDIKIPLRKQDLSWIDFLSCVNSLTRYLHQNLDSPFIISFSKISNGNALHSSISNNISLHGRKKYSSAVYLPVDSTIAVLFSSGTTG